ncbi:rhodanese-like domain-containing protein [Mesonia sp. K7]|nr:rhodanese-like domain-containing protein [Mesonia sp. K7]
MTVLSCANETSYKKVSPQEFEKIIAQEEVQLIDVRTPEEYKAGFIEGAENINFYEDFKSKIEKLDKSKPVAVYCKSGRRSEEAGFQMIGESGFTEVYDLDGGFLDWEEYQKSK